MEQKKRIRDYFETHRQELVEDIKAFIQVESVNGPAMPGMPFGEKNARMLSLAVEKARRFGLLAEVLDNYVAVIDLNEEERKLDILAHLDVVPSGEGWTVTEPFCPVVLDGKIYGRGASDDKGPAVAALYAVRAVKELGLPINGNVRLILGADEETSCRDTAYYYERYEEAPCSFSPDAEYPIINIEKGGLYTKYSAFWPEDTALPRILYVKGGTAGNVVPNRAEAVIEGISEEVLLNACRGEERATGVHFQLMTEKGNGEKLKIIAFGKSTHASTPWEGCNAVTGLIKLLTSLPIAESTGFSALCGLAGVFPHGDFYGKSAKIEMEDEASGVLTLGTNMLEFTLKGLMGKVDCRAPLCGTSENVLEVLRKELLKAGIDLDPESQMTPPHHVPEQSSFVQTLLKCYEEVMDEKGRCIAIGGGTYAHRLKNGVAFGCMKQGTDYHMHGADEFLIIDEIVKSAELFALVIANICG